MILGHERQWEYLKKVHEQKSFAHAYLFFGPQHVGKRTIAKEWAKLFFSVEAKEGIDAGTNPDVIFFSKENALVPTETESSISIDSIRELKRLCSLGSYSGGMRFVIVDGAEDMRIEAQNSFLKLLEEPPKNTIIILISADAEMLLPTVRSRSIPVEFGFVAESEIKKYLNKQALASSIDDIVEIALGRPGVAVRLSEDQKILKESLKKYASQKSILNSDLARQFRLSQDLARDEHGADEILFLMLKDIEKNITSGGGNLSLTDAAKRILMAREAMKRTPINKRLLLDTAFLAYADRR